MTKINNNYVNPLFSSYMQNDFVSFSKHVKSGVNINCINEENYSLISLIIKNSLEIKDNKKFFDLLISSGVNLKQIGWEKDLLTTCVIHQKDTYYAKELLKNNININSSGVSGSYEGYADEEYEEGWMFAEDGVIKVKYGPPIFEALKEGNIEYFELFLKNKASLDVLDSYGGPILHFLINGSCDDIYDNATEKKIFETLLDHDVDIYNRDETGSDIIKLLIGWQKKELFKSLFEKRKNINVNTRDKMGRTPLINSVSYGSGLLYTKTLIKHGANLDLYDVENINALIMSISCEDMKLFKLLVKSGANVSSSDKLGNNVLHFIANLNSHPHSKECCEIILNKNPNLLTEKNNAGKSALDIFKSSGIYKDGNQKFFDKFIKKANNKKSKKISQEL